ncbi:hypothetical protein [Sphingobium chungangianum]
MRLLAELKEHGVQLYPASSAIRIERDAVRFIDKGGAEQAAAADHVIVAKGATGDLTLADQVAGAALYCSRRRRCQRGWLYRRRNARRCTGGGGDSRVKARSVFKRSQRRNARCGPQTSMIEAI